MTFDPYVTAEATREGAVRNGIANLLGVVADNKYWMGRWLSEWAVGAPGLESAVAAAGIAQGHLGQARTLFPLVDEMIDGGFASPDQGRSRRYNMAVLDGPFATWGQAVATMYLVDPALDVVLRAVDPPGDELGRRLGRLLDESRFNAEFARGRVVELSTRWEHGRSHLEPHLHRALPEALCWFGPDGEEGVATLCEAGVLRSDGPQMRADYLDAVAPPLLELGYDVGITGEPGAWMHEELPWQDWNPLQRRLETTTG
jgi:ring-1,2-phenylacetyl-CoA epoxidase subunit PaaC